MKRAKSWTHFFGVSWNLPGYVLCSGTEPEGQYASRPSCIIEVTERRVCDLGTLETDLSFFVYNSALSVQPPAWKNNVHNRGGLTIWSGCFLTACLYLFNQVSWLSPVSLIDKSWCLQWFRCLYAPLIKWSTNFFTLVEWQRRIIFHFSKIVNIKETFTVKTIQNIFWYPFCFYMNWLVWSEIVKC